MIQFQTTSLRKTLLVNISLLALLLSSLSVFSAEMRELRGQRYCEILLGKDKYFSKNIEVYNTIGLNNCPAKLWNKVTVEKIKAQTQRSFVKLNGPRYWVIDGFKNTVLVNPKVTELGGINMRNAGTLQLGIIDLLSGQKPYKKHHVHRKTTWIYEAGKPIYEIENAKDEIFVMQSYSTQKHPQSESSLVNLGDKLKLPKNWKFHTRILEKDAFLTPVNEEAVVIQDDLLNTYQQETPDFNSENNKS